MKRRVFSAVASSGCRVRLAPLPPQMRYLKTRFLGKTTILLNVTARDQVLANALRDALAAVVPTDRRSGMVAG